MQKGDTLIVPVDPIDAFLLSWISTETCGYIAGIFAVPAFLTAFILLVRAQRYSAQAATCPLHKIFAYASRLGLVVECLICAQAIVKLGSPYPATKPTFALIVIAAALIQSRSVMVLHSPK